MGRLPGPSAAWRVPDDPDPSWRETAACRGTDTERWFQPHGVVPTELRALCGRCEVQRQCLAFALRTGATGYWAGTSESDRRALRRNSGAA